MVWVVGFFFVDFCLGLLACFKFYFFHKMLETLELVLGKMQIVGTKIKDLN